MFSQTCFWTVFTLSRKSFQFACRSLHDLLWTQSFVVQIAKAILTTTSIQTHVRCAHLCLDRVSFPPVGLPHSNSRPKCSAHAHIFQSIEPFTRLTVATRHQRGGAGFPPGTPCHAGEATFQRQKSFSTYRESRYMPSFQGV